MAISITHTTAADGTFSATGATEWNRAHSISGATQYGVFYAATTTSIDQDAGFTFGGSAAGTGLVGSAGTATTDVAAYSGSQTWNNAAVTFTGAYRFSVTDPAANAGSSATSIHSRWSCGVAGNTEIMNLSKQGVLTVASSVSAGTGVVALNGSIRAAAGEWLYWNGRAVLASSGTTVVDVFQSDGSTRGNLRAKFQSSDGTQGVASFGPALATTFTVKDGLITAIS